MEVRYKAGKFRNAVSVTPGDKFSMTLTEEELLADGSKTKKKQAVSEVIKKDMIISHWVMFFIPGTDTVGGMFGGEELLSNIKNIFQDSVEIQAGEYLII